MGNVSGRHRLRNRHEPSEPRSQTRQRLVTSCLQRGAPCVTEAPCSDARSACGPNGAMIVLASSAVRFARLGMVRSARRRKGLGSPRAVTGLRTLETTTPSWPPVGEGWRGRGGIVADSSIINESTPHPGHAANRRLTVSSRLSAHCSDLAHHYPQHLPWAGAKRGRAWLADTPSTEAKDVVFEGVDRQERRAGIFAMRVVIIDVLR